jgi:dienelactone hydrolase
MRKLTGHTLAAAVAALAASVALADGAKPFDAAAIFGARQTVTGISMSPDGQSVAYVVSTAGRGSALYTRHLGEGAKSVAALGVSGNPDRLMGCAWVSNDRVECRTFGVVRDVSTFLFGYSRQWAVNADGSNVRQLTARRNSDTRGLQLDGGDIIDWVPGQDGAVLTTHKYLPDDHIGSKVGSTLRGLGVDLLDTRTLDSRNVERPIFEATEYIADGRGTVRIMGTRTVKGGTGYSAGITIYHYRKQGSRDWQELGSYNYMTREGFNPYAVDPGRNVAYGFKKSDGRQALYSMALDGSMHEELVYANPDVDVDGLITIGRNARVVGVSYATDYRHSVYFDEGINKAIASLQRALPQHQAIQIVDSNLDESRLIVLAAGDGDPGTYYVFDRQSHRLEPFASIREALDGVALGSQKPVSYKASDGTMVPAYLTLPPGITDATGLPAIVMPHGGPDARDEWGFDWLAQFYAVRGFAVLQPNYRGSLGYGDEWYGNNAIRSWPTAISDVLDAGRWLAAQGIADPAKLAIVGWSYGGYAALQSAVTDSSVFKAVVAIAPLTDLQQYKNERRVWSDFLLTDEMIGDGPQVREGSPARNAEKIKVPVLLFHGTADRNVFIEQSKTMDKSLDAAHVPHKLVIFEGLDHGLEDSSARTQMLHDSEEFLRQAFAAPANSPAK